MAQLPVLCTICPTCSKSPGITAFLLPSIPLSLEILPVLSFLAIGCSVLLNQAQQHIAHSVNKYPMTVSISLGIIGLFQLFIWCWFNFGKWYLWRKLSISFRFSNFVEKRFLKYDLKTLGISLVSVFTTPFLFLILLIWIFSLCLVVNLDKGLSFLLIFSKTLLFVLLFIF